MRSKTPKVLHLVAGLPMLAHVLNAAVAAGADRHVVVVGREAKAVAGMASAAADGVVIAEQRERLGTAHAVLAAREEIAKGFDDIMVLFGDTPLTRPETLRRLRRALADGAEVAVLGFEAEDPAGYGRLLVEGGKLLAIREEKDASAEELEITLCNGGIMAFRGADVLEMLDRIGNENAKGEYYLTDLPEIARQAGKKVIVLTASEDEVMGINNRAELAKAEAVWQRRRREEFMLSGVTMTAPETVFLSHDTAIASDCTIEPHVVFGPGVSVGEGTSIKAFCHIEGAEIGPQVTVGPFARLRPGTRLEREAKVGNFCELKNAEVGEGAKVNHLSYIGDAGVGSHANIGAGTITCNYDGVNKHRTEIGSNTFIGSNSALVAPVSIGNNAYVASGSVIVEDVPDDAMGIARGRQSNKPGYAAEIRRRNEAMKKARS